MPHIALRNNDIATLKAENNWCVDFIDNDEGYNECCAREFPETKKAGQMRVRESLQKQKEMTKVQGPKMIAEITVSHGWFVDQTLVILNDEPMKAFCFYCATTSYKLSQRADGDIDLDLIHQAFSDYI